jgi:hypothetical protein
MLGGTVAIWGCFVIGPARLLLLGIPKDFLRKVVAIERHLLTRQAYGQRQMSVAHPL